MRDTAGAAHLEADELEEGEGAGQARHPALEGRIGQLDAPELLLDRILQCIKDALGMLGEGRKTANIVRHARSAATSASS